MGEKVYIDTTRGNKHITEEYRRYYKDDSFYGTGWVHVTRYEDGTMKSVKEFA
jgi:hypothetical protein